MKPFVLFPLILVLGKVQSRDPECCAKIGSESTKTLAGLKECLEKRAEFYSSMNGGDCPPSCMVPLFLEQCILKTKHSTLDTLGRLLRISLKQDINYTTVNTGACPIPDVVNMLTENKDLLEKWFKLFCICVRIKLDRRPSSDPPSQDEVLRLLLGCYRSIQRICDQQVFPDQNAFCTAILNRAKENIPCCWKMSPTSTPATTFLITTTPVSTVFPTTAPASTVKPTTAPYTTVSPTTTPPTTGHETTTPYTTETPSTSPTTTTDPCVGILSDICFRLENGTIYFLEEFRKCMRQKNLIYPTPYADCANQSTVTNFTIECFDSTSLTSPDSATKYMKVNKVFNNRLAKIIEKETCPATSVIKQVKRFKNRLIRWFEIFCDCLSVQVHEYYRTSGSCPNKTEMRTIVEKCDQNTTDEMPRAFLPNPTAFSSIYIRFISSYTNLN